MRERSSFEKEMEDLTRVEYDIPPPFKGQGKSTGPSLQGKGAGAKRVQGKIDAKKKAGKDDIKDKLKKKKVKPVLNVAPTATGTYQKEPERK